MRLAALRLEHIRVKGRCVPVHRHPLYRNRPKASYPVSERIHARTLTLSFLPREERRGRQRRSALRRRGPRDIRGMKLTLGTAQLGMVYGVANTTGMPDAAAAHRLIRIALELGIRSFDTAPAYGSAEERLGAALAGRTDVVVVTKALGVELERSVQCSRERLRVSVIDHVLLHDASDLKTPGVVPALRRLVADGVARSVGASVYTPAEAHAVLEAGLTSLQVPINLLDQRFVGLLDEVTVFARSAFLQGLLTLDPSRLPARVSHCAPTLRALHEMCARFDVKPRDVALAYVAQLRGVTSVVVGAETEAQIRECCDLVRRPLPTGLVEALRSRFAAVDIAVIDPSRWGSP